MQKSSVEYQYPLTVFIENDADLVYESNKQIFRINRNKFTLLSFQMLKVLFDF